MTEPRVELYKDTDNPNYVYVRPIINGRIWNLGISLSKADDNHTVIEQLKSVISSAYMQGSIDGAQKKLEDIRTALQL